MPPSPKPPVEVGGYTVLPLSLPPLRSFPKIATHFLYLAEHNPRIPSPTASRSVFLVNIPFDTTAAHLKYLFSTQLGLSAGRIEDTQFEGSRKPGRILSEAASKTKPEKKGVKRKRDSENDFLEDLEGATLPSTWDRDLQTNGLTAVIQFVDRASMEAALRAVKVVRKQRKNIVWGEGMDGKVPPLGLARYSKHHQLTYPEKHQLLESVNNYMTAFAAKEAAQSKLQGKQRQEPDADGFVTVTRGGRTKPPKQEAAQAQAAKHNERQRGLDDFYRFQSREKRKARAGELVKRFEEDREKVRKMKERRGRFRPE